MEKNNQYTDGANLSLELYNENGELGIYLSDDCGGSGITVTGNTPEEVADKIKDYIADYFYPREEEDDEDESDYDE
jgi:hypothetical protein